MIFPFGKKTTFCTQKKVLHFQKKIFCLQRIRLFYWRKVIVLLVNANT